MSNTFNIEVTLTVQAWGSKSAIAGVQRMLDELTARSPWITGGTIETIEQIGEEK